MKILEETLSDTGLNYSYDSRIKKLTIREAKNFPNFILEYPEQIKILDMSYGSIAELPSNFSQLKNLEVCFFSFNLFTKFPEVLSNCLKLRVIGFKSCSIAELSENALPKSLEWLILTDNKLTKLPKSIGKLENLRKLALAGNLLTSLPSEITNCKNLEFIRISANRFQETPFNIIKQLPKLAWFADSGNPYSYRNNLRSQKIKTILWEDMVVEEKIGESNQNTVYRAEIKSSKEKVALKIFGGHLTSDGYPEDDINTSIAVGNSGNLIGAIGEVIGNPESKKCLVMPLIPSSYKKLGLAPDFYTITRDTFPEKTKLTSHEILEILKSIAAACCELHSKGIMHGDIYAHNILSNENGKSFLGDFGAASMYDKDREPEREVIDLRAYGYLAEDLIGLCDECDTDELGEIVKIKEICLSSNVKAFREVKNLLNS